MAETGKKPTADAVAPTNDPAPDIARRSENTPQTVEPSRNASLRARTLWPHTSFVVEGLPEVTREGVGVTKVQADAIEKAAKASGVSVSVEEVK